MCPHNSMIWRKCNMGMTHYRECLYPEEFKYYKETAKDRLLNFFDDCRIMPAVLIYGFSKFLKRS
jgi:hypothetical protein